MSCPLCEGPGGVVLIECADYRIIRAEEPDYPGFLRVIWRAHVAEMSDLPAAEQASLMHAVWAAERALRGVFAPDKINLASFGNVVSHLHWHVIARKKTDRHFPQPVWAAPVRAADDIWPQVDDETLRHALSRALAAR
jgi:diadenosine tetraphosphate (Ap4A) HIT family hydrolase